MGGRRILTDAQIDEMARLRERGWGVQRIADHFMAAGTPISAGSINWQCLMAGADRPAKFWPKPTKVRAIVQRNGHVVRAFTAEDDAKLFDFEAQGLGISEIARRLGRKPNSIRGRLLTLARRDARREAMARCTAEQAQ